MPQKAALLALLLAAAVVATTAMPLPSTAAGRKLQGTLTITASQGDLWSAQHKSSTNVATTTDENGQSTKSRSRASGSALAVNGRRCLKEDCDKPVAEVSTYANAGSSGATAHAEGEKVAATKTRATVEERYGNTLAAADGKTGAYSIQRDTTASTTSNVAVNALALADGGVWGGIVGSEAIPENSGHQETRARLDGGVTTDGTALPSWYPRHWLGRRAP